MEGDFSRKVSSLFILLLLTTSLAFGQGIVTGSIVGTVQDQQQAVVSGAKITAKNAATNLSYSGDSSAAGTFALRGLPQGTYSVSIEASGFSKLQIANVTVSPGLDTNLGIRSLTVGAAEEVINVEGAAPLVESTTSAITNTFDNKKITTLPTGINFDNLALYAPGVAAGGAAGRGNSNGAQLSVNGQRTRSNNFQIDGQYNNDNSVAGPGIFLENPDLLSEFQISNNYSAEFGRNTGSVINYVTKSGTNAFHGTAFWFYRGSRFDSLNKEEKSPVFGFCRPGEDPTVVGCEPVKRFRDTNNIFGFTFGGPIIKDKGWFFISGTWDRDRTGGSPAQAGQIAPTPAGLATLNAAFPGNAGVAALLAASPGADYFANFSRSFTNLETRAVTDGVTNANVEFGTPSFAPASVFNLEQWTAKVDWQLTSKDRVFFRYVRDFEVLTNSDAFGTGSAGLFTDIPSGGKQYGGDWTRTWSPTFVNQLRFGHAFLNVGFEDGTFPCNRSNFTECFPRVGFQDTDFLGWGMLTNAPQGRTVKNYQVQDNATWVKGRHSLKFGGEYDRQDSPSDFLPGANGSYTFANYDTLIQNTPSAFSLTDGPLGFPFVENDVYLYFQDDWRVKDNLTLNLGVRWEWTSQSINLLHDLAVANQAGSNPFWDTSLPENVIAPPLVPDDFNNFAPVVGFAWTPRIFESILGKDKTVIRGGFRISYDPAFYNIHLNVATSAPVVNASGTLTGAVGVAIPGLPGTATFTGNDVRAVGLAFIPTGVNPGFRTQTTVSDDFRNPYTQQWSLGMQREINSKVAFEVRYLGSHTVGQFQSLNANPSLASLIDNGFDGSVAGRQDVIPDGITPCLDNGPDGLTGTAATSADDPPGRASRYADCNFRNRLTRANTAFAIYHSLQSRFDIRNWHGITSTLSYTWSKNIDNASEIFTTGGVGLFTVNPNPFSSVALSRGNSLFDYRHLLGLQFIYDLP
ncbi:MAG TPA: TonB-dependent receptor, partial [Terriglobales bacterium]|nr:TonB-dependent receptor [Terriglobales bacterium]